YRLRPACLLPPGTTLRPGFRQVQPIGHRKAGGMIGNRQRHRHLAIGLLTELTAILVVHADRMLALLGERGVVDDPRLNRSALLDRRQHALNGPWPARPRPTRPRWRQNAATTGAVPPSALEPSAPPSAQRSCVPQAASGPCNSRAAVWSAPHDRSRFQDRLHTP